MRKIDLAFLLGCFRKNFVFTVSSIFVGIALSLVYVSTLKNSAKAVAIVQPATVGQLNSVAPIQVEPLIKTLDRFKTKTFYNKDVVTKCGLPDVDNSYDYLRLNLHARITGGNLIQLEYTDSDAEMAKTCLNSVVEHMSNVQGQLMLPIIVHYNKLKDIYSKHIEILSGNENDIKNMLKTRREGDLAYKKLFLNYVYNNSKIQKITIEMQNEGLSFLLSPILTKSLELVEPIYVTTNDTGPIKKLIIVSGFFSGLLFAIFYIAINKRY